MKSGWNDDEAAVAALAGDVGLCAYASRLLGADRALVLAGGGNSSVKATGHDVFGDPVEVLHVKGSGADMSGLQPHDFAPLRLDRVARLAELAALSDAVMANELKAASLDASAPAPSVESILHAILPFRFVLHTHADAVLAITNTLRAEALVTEVYGDDVVTVPYVMPGFALARLCATRFPAHQHAGTVGMVLLNHGLFTFADDARTAYEHHIDLVARALARIENAPGAAPAAGDPDEPPLLAPADAGEGGVEDHAFGAGAGDTGPAAPPPELGAIAALRRDISAAAGRPMIVRTGGPAGRRFAARPDVARLSQAGPATPDHVLRTKRVPQLGRDVTRYATAYRSYVDGHRHRLGDREIVPADPAPRVVIDQGLGVLAAGERVADAVTAAAIYEHTVWVIEHAYALGDYAPATEADVFDVEYWELEQAKLARRPAPLPLTGRVAVVTGAASGIGRATAEALLAAGAAVVGLDRDAGVEEVGDGPEYQAVLGDVRDPEAVEDAVARSVRGFGGIDVVVVNAGVFPHSEPLAVLAPERWAEAMDVNAGAAALLLGATHPFLRLSPAGGSVVVVGSKNVPAPGRGAGAYSASKAALTQIARVAALEWARDGIRVNVVHPDAVFDTGLWTDDVIAERAAAAGVTPEQYRTRNLLGVEVTSADVAAAIVALCGPAFGRTTGAQIAVDGGNERVI
ncbi:MAG TPA: SDR family oxidoreductase [Acidimicrobiales bacterium]|nr:SDR family oxidoreductase [Acidimicrobiales bacterium]